MNTCILRNAHTSIANRLQNFNIGIDENKKDKKNTLKMYVSVKINLSDHAHF